MIFYNSILRQVILNKPQLQVENRITGLGNS